MPISSSPLQTKYPLNIDGTVAAYRFPLLLAGGSAVIKQDSPYYEHFYRDVAPFQHYIPIKRDLSDLLEKVSTVGSVSIILSFQS